MTTTRCARTGSAGPWAAGGLLLAAVLLLVWAVTSAPGCALLDPAQAQERRTAIQERLDQVQEALAAERARHEELLVRAARMLAEAEKSGDPEKIAAAEAERRRVAETNQKITELEQRARSTEELLQRVTNPDGSVNIAAASREASQFLPYPFNLILLLGGPTLAGLVQEIRVRRSDAAARSLVNSIDKLRIEEPTVRDAFKRHKDAIGRQLTPRARKVIAKETIT
jgi:hypothetical protein